MRNARAFSWYCRSSRCGEKPRHVVDSRFASYKYNILRVDYNMRASAGHLFVTPGNTNSRRCGIVITLLQVALNVKQ